MSETCASNQTIDDTKPSDSDQYIETDEKDLDNEADDTDLPIDRGWAWMILAGAYINSVLVVGMLRLEGIFFNEYQKKFQSSSGITSLIPSVQNGVYSLFSLIVMLIGSSRLNTRVSLLIGGLLVSVAYIINSRSTRIEYVIIGQGVLSGVAYSFIHLPIIVILSQYFKKRRGLANSISVSGSSMGGLVLAPVVTAMFEYYGYSGTFLIMSGIALHCWVAAALFRPLEFYKRRLRMKSEELKPLTSSFKSTALDSQFNIKGVQKPSNFNGIIVDGLQSNISNSSSLPQQPAIGYKILDPICDEKCPLKDQTDTLTQHVDIKHSARSLLGKGEITVTESSLTNTISGVIESICQSDGARLASVVSLNVPIGSVHSLKEVKEDKTNTKASAIARAFRTLFDLELMKSPLFWTLLFQASLTCSGLVFMSVFFGPRAREIGLDETQIGLLYSVMNIVELFCLVLIGFISDLKFCRRSTLIAIAALVEGILANCMALFTTFESFIACVCIHGVFGGMYFALFAVNLVDYMGMEKIDSCLGFTNLIHGLSISILFTTLGSLRDISGNYISSFHLVGSFLLLSFLLNMFTPFVERWVKKRQS
ncbi:hypothetical protein ACJMK2_013731 [Sinanodonta woodiana]|uniref:Uncharacterized protein n=1 Tax=Sinanodonta woodiana TaxID=1069815 RepID=A0ABD3V1E9_SINWO